MAEFIFATGIENSYPLTMVKDAGGIVRPLRRDQMKETGHHDLWEEDFALVEKLGIPFLRYGPPYYLVQEASGKCNFSLKPEQIGAHKRFDMRERLDALCGLGITPIIDLCHFGLPDWATGFQDSSWPEKFAGYARTFAETFTDVVLYTPINEIYVAANFSGQLTLWNERAGTDSGFVAALCNLCRANVRAMEEILKVRPGALFIQSESSEYFHPETEKDIPAAEFLNSKRFLSLDLSYGHAVDAEMYRYLKKYGMTEEDYEFFMTPRPALLQACVMGNDYYNTNEHWVDGAGTANPSNYREAGEIFGYYVITHQYYERYGMPFMHTETNRANRRWQPDESLEWLQKEWANVVRLKQDRVPIIGFTWYGLVDLVGWDKLLDEGNMEPVWAGLCTLDRAIRPVGERYRKIIQDWRQALQGREIETGGAGVLALDEAERGTQAIARANRTAEYIKALPRGRFQVR
ncbi:MAG: family 1 glycosylhydrolase [Verrucomicrobia bacterium]|nr:family 1 glycosylhydrolase [Verrucomicrobiota bacterium]